MTALSAALISSLLWTVATQVYAFSGKRMPIRKLNLIKALLAAIFFGIHTKYFSTFQISTPALPWVVASGILGFGIGDLLIFTAFTRMGPARTMILASFQPAMVAIAAFFIFGRSLETPKILGMGLMMFCVLILSREKRQGAKPDAKILFYATLGLFLEAIGVLFTKQAFLISPELSSATINFYRVISTLPLLLLLNLGRGHWSGRKAFFNRNNAIVAAGAFLGTYGALFFYLTAISKAEVAVVVSVTLVSMFLSSTFEHIRDRILPTRYFLGALVSMGLGLYLLHK